MDIIGFLHIWGSPLRMRGKAQTQLSFTVPKRITPAYAGKRMMMEILTATVRDHPCVCGEKSPRSHSHLRDPGSPLRMRGKVQQAGRVHIRRRITPAYAGKSWLPAKRALSLGDHPCVCGEKPESDLWLTPKQGITPAYAGKSENPPFGEGQDQDHPCVCGEKVVKFRKYEP